MRVDVAVIGAGAAGCSAAYHLTRLGARSVAVIDPLGPAGGASGAAAGILTRLHEIENPDPTLPIGLRCLRELPRLAARLEEETGDDLSIRRVGIILLRSTPEAPEWSRRAARAARRLGVPVERVTRGDVARLEPGVRPGDAEGIYGPHERQMDPARYVRALMKASASRGARLLLSRAVSWRVEGRRVLAVGLPKGEVQAGAFILAGGAWSGRIGRLLGLELPVVPVRGQLLRLKTPEGTLRHIVDLDRSFLVPWPRGVRAGARPAHVTVGTTLERVGLRPGPTETALASLKRFAGKFCPALRGAPPLEAVWGFRPETPDRLPLLGRLPRHDNLWIASGHYRQGIILSPWTGRVIAQWIATGRRPPGLASFDPARFGPP